MATSSIFANIVINSEESAKAIVKAFEDFESKGSPRHEIKTHPVSDPAEIKRIVSKWGGRKK